MISVIIPVFNEEKNIDGLFEMIRRAKVHFEEDFEVIFVNDGSTDKSEDKIKNRIEKDDRFKLISFSRNFGQTAAIQAGIDHSKGDIIVPMDGDQQNDPEDIPKLVEKMNEGFDVVSGWRKNRADNPMIRTLPSRIANKIISAVSGVHLHDYGCTLKAYRKSLLKNISLYGEMHRFIPIYTYWMGGKVTEMIVTHHPRTHGRSKYGLERTVKVILDLIVIQFLFRYSLKPIYIFGGIGLVSIGLSFLAGIYAIFLKLFQGVHFIRTPLPLLVVLCLITGVMCILMGLLAEMVVRTYYESQKKPIYVVRSTLNV